MSATASEAQGRRNAAKFRNAYAALRFGDGPAVRPYQVLTLPPMNRETPTVQSERGLSQTAARILARALNQPDAWPGGAPVSDPARFGSWSQCTAF
jgi:hypothetical protein